jgi:hypothetical protein
MSLGSVDEEIMPYFYKMKNVNNISSIDAIDMKLPPFDAPCYDESNKP